jgi:hypothetical protein
MSVSFDTFPIVPCLHDNIKRVYIVAKNEFIGFYLHYLTSTEKLVGKDEFTRVSGSRCTRLGAATSFCSASKPQFFLLVLLEEEEQLLQAAAVLPKKSSRPSGDKNLKHVYM